MSTVNFSVPEDVKDLFNEVFAGRNKSAIIAGLMLEAVERALHEQRRHEAYVSILRNRKRAPSTTVKRFRSSREAGRP